MWLPFPESLKKKPALLRWLIPGLLITIMTLWEIVEHGWLEADEPFSMTVVLDILLVAILSALLGVLAARMQEEIVTKESAQNTLRQRNQRLTALYALVTQINQTREPDKILAIALDYVLCLTDIEGAAIWLLDNPNPLSAIKARPDLDDSFIKAIRQVEQATRLNERVVQAEKPIIINNVSATAPIANPVGKQAKLQSCACVPVRSHSKVIGALCVYSDRQQQLSSQDIDLLTTIASQAGAAIEGARLYETMRRQLSEITILQGIAWLTSSSLDIKHMLHTLVRALNEVFDYAVFSIFLLEERELILYAQSESNGNPLPPPDTKLCRQAVSTGSPAFVSSSEEIAAPGQIRELSLPLKMKDTVLGILHVQAGLHKTLDQTDLKLLEALANQISLAINNAQLYTQVKNLNEQLQAMIEERTRQLEASQLEVGQKAHQLQQLLVEVTRTQDEERGRIALDMHDGLTQLVIGAMYESQAAEEALAVTPDFTLKKLQSIQTLLQQTKDEIHRIVHDLRPPTIDKKGLSPAIKRYLDGYQQLVGIPCCLNVSGYVFRFDTEVETAIYRIVQEAMHNTGKHARAGSVQVSLDFGLKNVKIIIQDDGQGFDIEAALTLSKEHLGLVGMKRRAQRIGGRLEIQSAPGRGTRIMLEVPRPEMGWAGD